MWLSWLLQRRTLPYPTLLASNPTSPDIQLALFPKVQGHHRSTDSMTAYLGNICAGLVTIALLVGTLRLSQRLG